MFLFLFVALLPISIVFTWLFSLWGMVNPPDPGSRSAACRSEGGLFLLNYLFQKLLDRDIGVVRKLEGNSVLSVRMKHGVDHIMKHFIVPDLLPVFPEHELVAQSDGHLAASDTGGRPSR